VIPGAQVTLKNTANGMTPTVFRETALMPT
jgi:hypothetical protein